MSFIKSNQIPDCFRNSIPECNDDVEEHKWRETYSSLQRHPEDKRSTSLSASGDVSLFGNKIFKLGEEGSGTNIDGQVQDFHHLREKHLSQGISGKNLFVDPSFPANRSMFNDIHCKIAINYEEIKWMRPMEIDPNHNPKFLVDGFSRFDVNQGLIGDCWLVAALTSLAMHPKLFSHVVPEDQDFDKNYTGIFHFRFWHFGRWVDVVIDDQLPTHNQKLVFLHSTSSNEFWSALLEKAYAKLHGSWGALMDKFVAKAMEDLTGGISTVYFMQAAPSDLFQTLLQADKSNALIGAAVPKVTVDGGKKQSQVPDDGIVELHAYSVTRVYEHEGRLNLLRLRNPWGDDNEWTGAFSDNWPEWDKYKELKLKEKLNFKDDADGEFWIPFELVKKRFQTITICYFNPYSLTASDNMIDDGNPWSLSQLEGKWVRGVTAGGRDEETFQNNRQYRITLEQPAELGTDNECRVIVTLMIQVDGKTVSPKGKIAFKIYRLPERNIKKTAKPLDTDFFKKHRAIPKSETVNHSLNCRMKLSAGSYCIVPYTIQPGQEVNFLLRVFSDKPSIMEEYDQKIGRIEVSNTVHHRAQSYRGENKVERLFRKYTVHHPQIGWEELREIFKETKHTGYIDDKTCQLMAYGAMGEKEIKNLELEDVMTVWNEIKHLVASFQLYGKKDPTFLSTFDLKKALNSAGFTLSNEILIDLVRRYGEKDKTDVTLAKYLKCGFELKKMIFKQNE